MSITLASACRRLIPLLCAGALVSAACGEEVETPPAEPAPAAAVAEIASPAAPPAVPVDAPDTPAGEETAAQVQPAVPARAEEQETESDQLENRPEPSTVADRAVPAAAVAEEASSPTPEGVPVQIEVHVQALPSGIPPYDRDDWKHWNDTDGDCQDARQEVLIAESLAPVAYTDDRACRVDTGFWVDPYTGEAFDDPGDLDVDHMVPLANTHRSGGWSWDAARREQYANDLSFPGHLIAVHAGANRAKGARGPEEWRPPLRSYWCEYAIDWIIIKNHWGLTVTEAEFGALQEMLGTTLTRASGAPPYSSLPTDNPAPGTDASAVPGLLYDPTGPDRDCGDFGDWEQAQAFYEAAGGPADDRHRLDGNRDGVACESLPGAP